MNLFPAALLQGSSLALEHVRDKPAFSGTINVTLGRGSCTYTVAIQVGESRLITAIGIVGTVLRKAKVVIGNIYPAISLGSWQEVSDF